MNSTPKDSKPLVVFFDGHCGLCNGFVDVLLRMDRRGRIKFSALQSEFAAQHIPASFLNDLSSVVVLQGVDVWTEDLAVLKVGEELGGLGLLLARLFRFVPGILRRALYRWVARHRYQIFGRSKVCRRPTPLEQSRFL